MPKTKAQRKKEKLASGEYFKNPLSGRLIKLGGQTHKKLIEDGTLNAEGKLTEGMKRITEVLQSPQFLEGKTELREGNNSFVEVPRRRRKANKVRYSSAEERKIEVGQETVLAGSAGVQSAQVFGHPSEPVGTRTGNLPLPQSKAEEKAQDVDIKENILNVQETETLPPAPAQSPTEPNRISDLPPNEQDDKLQAQIEQKNEQTMTEYQQSLFEYYQKNQNRPFNEDEFRKLLELSGFPQNTIDRMVDEERGRRSSILSAKNPNQLLLDYENEIAPKHGYPVDIKTDLRESSLFYAPPTDMGLKTHEQYVGYQNDIRINKSAKKLGTKLVYRKIGTEPSIAIAPSRKKLVLRASDGDERALLDVTVPEKIESNLPRTGIEKTFDGKGTNLGGQFQGFDLTNPSEPLIGLHRGGTIDDVWIY